jgi:hypothetical protein
MENLEYWKLCDQLTVMQAALLMVGVDPSSEVGMCCERRDSDERLGGYDAAKTAIATGLRAKAIKGRLLTVNEGDGIHPLADYSVDVTQSTVEVQSLRSWLASRGIKSGFFFPTAVDTPGYLDPRNPRFAPKLAAAIQAWEAVTDPNGKHPKQAVIKWLREHATRLGLADEQGKPNETAIEEVAKVVNWQPGGGAPRTPTR